MDNARQVVEALRAKGCTLATAESLTGGMLGEQITGVSGSSAVYRGGVVSYCNEIKSQVLRVSQNDLDTQGAVSEPVARQMAQGARNLMHTSFGLSTTGIAGPTSDETGKPVGLVYIGFASESVTQVRELHLQGNRRAIREQTCRFALQLLLDCLD